LVSGPNIASQVIESPVSLVDIYPTILDITNVSHPTSHTLDGSSLFNVNSGSSSKGVLSAGSWQELEVGEAGKAHHQHHALLTSDYKYILYSSGEDELYNIIDDREEFVDLTSASFNQQFRRIAHEVLGMDVDSIRSPISSFQNLFYGDFEQGLNGWFPSVADSKRYVQSSNSELNTRHLVLADNSAGICENKNVRLRQEGEYKLNFQAYSESEGAQLRFNLKFSDGNSPTTLMDQIFSINSTVSSYSHNFNIPEIPVDAIKALRIQLLTGAGVHIDNIEIINILSQEESLSPCSQASLVATDIALSSVEIDTLKSLIDQPDFNCVSLSGLAQQQWYKVIPETEFGIIITRLQSNFDPIIQLSDNCAAPNDGDLQCSNLRNDNLEALLISAQPGQEYAFRVANKKRILSQTIPGRTLYENMDHLIPQISDGILTTNHPVYSNINIQSVTFRLYPANNPNNGQDYTVAYNENAEYDLNSLNLVPGNYGIQARYMINLMSIETPFGPPTLFEIGNSNLAETGDIELSKFLVSPNPVPLGATSVTISTPPTTDDYTARPLKISLIDILGRTIIEYPLTQWSNHFNFEFPSNLGKGIYFIRVLDMNGDESLLKLMM